MSADTVVAIKQQEPPNVAAKVDSALRLIQTATKVCLHFSQSAVVVDLDLSSAVVALRLCSSVELCTVY